MAYIGTRQSVVRIHRTKYVVGIGDLPAVGSTASVTEHGYQCDHCGAVTWLPYPATEDFYCHSEQCNYVRLISIAPAPGILDPCEEAAV